MKFTCYLSPLAISLLVATSARADPRLDEKVYSPYIQNGVAELETRTAQQIGGASAGDMTTVVEGEYGVNDRLSLAVVGTLERSRADGSHFTGVGIEAVYYLGQIPKLGIDTGAYLEYKHGLNGDPEVLEGKLLLAKNVDRFQGLVNLIVERPLGSKDEDIASYGYAASATWRTAGTLRIGAEAFGNLGTDHDFPGRQGGYVGPQVLWEARPKGLPFEIDFDAGWLFPFGTEHGEARSQLRFGIELEKRF
jgi:hypothetical protein